MLEQRSPEDDPLCDALETYEGSTERFLELAAQRFLNSGYAATTVRDLAREAGVTIHFVYKTFKDKAGETQKRTEWHSIVAWGRLAEICGEFLTKSKQVYIEGSIRTGKWEDRDGKERKSYDIVARFMQMLSPSPNGNGAKPKQANSTEAPESSEEDNPFRQDENDEMIPF